MDSFDNRMEEMEREIMEIKHDITSIKTINHNAIHSITNSINTLSKPKSSSIIKSSSTHLYRKYPKEHNTKQTLSKNKSELILINNSTTPNPKSQANPSQSCRNKSKVNIHLNHNDIRSNYDYKHKNLSYNDPTINNNFYINNNNKIIDKQKHHSSISPPIEKEFTNAMKPYLYLDKASLNSSSSRYHYNIMHHTLHKGKDYCQIYMKPKTKGQQYLTTNSSILQSNSNVSSKYNNQFNTIDNTNMEDNDIDYKGIVNNIVDMINRSYSNRNFIVTIDNLIQCIQEVLDFHKRMKFFVKKLSELFNKDENRNESECSNMLSNDELFNWVVYLKQRNKKCENAICYQHFCEKIMNQHKITSFKEFKEFIAQSICTKSRNEQFVNGMKKILCEDYSKLSPSSKYNTISIRNKSNNDNNINNNCGLRGRVVRSKKKG